MSLHLVASSQQTQPNSCTSVNSWNSLVQYDITEVKALVEFKWVKSSSGSNQVKIIWVNPDQGETTPKSKWLFSSLFKIYVCFKKIFIVLAIFLVLCRYHDAPLETQQPTFWIFMAQSLNSCPDLYWSCSNDFEQLWTNHGHTLGTTALDNLLGVIPFVITPSSTYPPHDRAVL